MTCISCPSPRAFSDPFQELWRVFTGRLTNVGWPGLCSLLTASVTVDSMVFPSPDGRGYMAADADIVGNRLLLLSNGTKHLLPQGIMAGFDFQTTKVGHRCAP